MQGRTARRVLVHLGYDVDVVESRAGALELMTNAEQHYDVLLIDVRLNEALDGRAPGALAAPSVPTRRARER